MNWMSFHISEELLIALLCLLIGLRAYGVSRSPEMTGDRDRRSRAFILAAGFLILGLNSLIHAVIHAAGFNQNLLYQTLLGYCLGLLTLILAISTERPWRKRFFPLLYLPLLVLLLPQVYERFPIFNEFRPLVWIIIAYLSGIVSILYMAAYYQTRLTRFLLSALGHLLICTSAIGLFFPSGIGANAWIFGHILRPVGFLVLFFSINRLELKNLSESILYKFITTFSLMAAIPVVTFGMVVFYENLHPIQLLGKKLIVFHLVLLSMASSLFFALVLILKLMRPLLRLKSSVDRVAAEDPEGTIETTGNDEIGVLAGAFNDMLAKLRDSFKERERLTLLAATGELSATLAHEIKNPLNAIGSAALYLKKNFRGELAREFSKVIYDEVMRINKLTSNLLNFARPLRSELKPYDINLLVLETVNLLKEESEERGVAIESKLQDNPAEVLVDYNLMKQLLINLILNSFDAVSGEGVIRVATSAENGDVLISVSDNGTGIAESDQERIFNPFFTTKTRGTGLGLAFSRKVAKEHGGDIEVRSTPGEGSEFTIHIPARR
jgi:signal transduction histidine kinase